MRNLLISSILLFVGHGSFAQWSTTLMPHEQEQVSGAANFTKVYAAGGFNHDLEYQMFVQQYDRVADEWYDDATLFLNTGRIKVATVLVGEKLICAGGWIYPSQV